MTPAKIRLGILFGGRSAEHEVSLQSARNIISSLDRSKYDVVLIGIDRDGGWHLNEDSHFLLNEDNPALIRLEQGSEKVTLRPGAGENQLVRLRDGGAAGSLDVVFPVLHGPYGEDGTIQGFLKLADVPFVGAGVVGSAVGMDKDVMKRLLRDAGIPIARFLVAREKERGRLSYADAAELLGPRLFVKPANLGSSVGISRVEGEAELERALDEAFSYDTKILIEEAVSGREIECSVLGGEEPVASLPGEVVPKNGFYSYRAKYIDEDGAALIIPARLEDAVVKKVQDTAVRAFRTLCCEGMARVDFFLTPDDRVLVNEINTIPGFTGISMYPKLWEATGMSTAELIDRLIQIALRRHRREKALSTRVEL